MVCSALILTFQFELVVPPSPTRTGGHWKSSKFTFTVCEEAYKARCQALIASLECILTALSFNCSALWLRDDLLGFPLFQIFFEMMDDNENWLHVMRTTECSAASAQLETLPCQGSVAPNVYVTVRSREVVLWLTGLQSVVNTSSFCRNHLLYMK